MNRNGLISIEIGLMALGVAVSACSTTSPPTSTVTVTAPASPPTVSDFASGPTPVVSPTPTGPKSVIETDGTYLVGTDILPGMYRTPGGSACYWARLRSLDTSDIIDNNNSTGPQVIEILPTDRAFKSSNCQTWTLEPGQASAPQPPPVATASDSAPSANYQSNYESLRCPHRAVLTLQTTQSAVAICDHGTGGYTYKGLRLKDGARIDIDGAMPTASGFTVTNNGTRYDVSRGGLVINTDGDVYTEPAVTSGP